MSESRSRTRARVALMAVALACGLILAPAAHAGVGQIKGVVVKLLDELGITTGGVYTVPGHDFGDTANLDVLVFESADTDGVRLDLASGELEVREGDDSAFGDLEAYRIKATKPDGSQNVVYLDANGDEVRITSDAEFTFSSSASNAAGAAADTFIGRVTNGTVYVGATTGSSNGVLSTGTVACSAVRVTNLQDASANTLFTLAPGGMTGAASKDLTIGSGGQAIFDTGSAAAPSWAFSSEATGNYLVAAGRMGVSVAGSYQGEWRAGELRGGAGVDIRIQDPGELILQDAYVGRSAAGVVYVGATTATADGTLVAAVLNRGTDAAIDIPGAGTSSVRVGSGSAATATNAIAVGVNAQATGQDSIVVGNSADCNDAVNCVIIGDGASVGDSGTSLSVVIGDAASAGTSSNSYVVVGAAAAATDGSSVTIGYSADSSNSLTVSVGANAQASNSAATAVGASANASGNGASAFGRSCVASGTGALAVGNNATAAFNYATAIGYSATATKANQLVVGGNTAEIVEVVIGEGVTNTAPVAELLVTTTNGSGTDVHATDLVLQSGLSTGNAAVTSMVFKTPDVGSTGATLQTATTRFTLTEGSATFTDPVAFPSFTVSTLPAATAGRLIYVSDETGGGTLAMSDGSNWRRVYDYAIVS